MRIEDEIQEYLKELAAKVKLEARRNLELGTLRNTLEVEAEKDSISVIMQDYGIFQELGVSGTKKKYDTPFSYKKKLPPVKALLPWIKKKGLRLRDKKTGRFVKGTQKDLAFIISRSIFKNGIKPTLFLTKAFETALKDSDLNDLADKIINKLKERE